MEEKCREVLTTVFSTGITTTSKLIPRKVKRNFSEIKMKANVSVNNKSKTPPKKNILFIAQKESLKEKKELQEKIKSLQNQINVLKTKSDIVNKKNEKEIEQQNKIKNVVNYKNKLKQVLINVNNNKKLELEQKKDLIMLRKQKYKDELKESAAKIKIYKINQYKQAYNERKKIIQEKQLNNSKFYEEQHNIVEKIREQRNISKEKNVKKIKDNDIKINNMYKNEFMKNINENNKLKNEMKKLEKIKSRVIKKINGDKSNIFKNRLEYSLDNYHINSKENNNINFNFSNKNSFIINKKNNKKNGVINNKKRAVSSLANKDRSYTTNIF